MISFVKSDSMKINVHKEQEKFLSNKSKIEKAIKRNEVLTFDIFDDSLLIGFVMLKEFKKGCFFCGILLLIINIKIKIMEQML